MSKSLPNVHVVPLSKFPAPFFGSEGYGVFVDFGANRMQVGAILPYPANKVYLNVMIIKEMELPDYEPGELMETFDSVEAAVDAARAFLGSKYKGP